MTSASVSYLILGATFLVIGAVGLWGIEAAFWALPVVLVSLGIWGLLVAARHSSETDSGLKR
ncbi:MAG: hypothetical protein ACC652_13290 [Acidimicrobiales bacterium]